MNENRYVIEKAREYMDKLEIYHNLDVYFGDKNKYEKFRVKVDYSRIDYNMDLEKFITRCKTLVEASIEYKDYSDSTILNIYKNMYEFLNAVHRVGQCWDSVSHHYTEEDITNMFCEFDEVINRFEELKMKKAFSE